MNDELQQQLAEYLKAISETAKSGASFVADQAPLVVQEKIAFGRVMEPLLLVAALAVLWFGWTLCKKANQYLRNDSYEFIPLYMIGEVSIIVGGIMSCIQAQASVLAWVAPRLYVLEWAMGLVKGAAK